MEIFTRQEVVKELMGCTDEGKHSLKQECGKELNVAMNHRPCGFKFLSWSHALHPYSTVRAETVPCILPPLGFVQESISIRAPLGMNHQEVLVI
jgi:hypothetical protein